MNRNFQVLFLIITLSVGSLFGMEKPKAHAKASKLAMAEVALKAADVCYFGLNGNERDYIKAAELYKRVLSQKEDLFNSYFASHMLTVMAFAGQGKLSLQDWQNDASKTQALLAEIYKNQAVKNDFLTTGLKRFSRILKVTPIIMHSITSNASAQEKDGIFFTNLHSKHLNFINKLFILYKINKVYKNKIGKDYISSVNFEKGLLSEVTKWVESLTQYFDWNIQYQKEEAAYDVSELKDKVVQTIKETEKYQANIFSKQDPLPILKNLTECHINLLKVIKIEADIFKEVILELVTTLASLFYFKKIKNEDAPSALECLQVAAKAVRNDDYITTISKDINNNPLDALNVIGSFYRKARWLNLERAEKYLELANHSNYLKIIPNAFIAMGEVYLHGLGVQPDYKKALEFFRLVINHGSYNPNAQIRAMFALGHMYFHGDIKNTHPDAAQPNYKDAVTYLRSAFSQNYVLALKSNAAILLGQMYHYGYYGAVDLEEALQYYNFVVNNSKSEPLKDLAQKEITAIQSDKELMHL